jgi:hypothetical protein
MTMKSTRFSLFMALFMNLSILTISTHASEQVLLVDQDGLGIVLDDVQAHPTNKELMNEDMALLNKGEFDLKSFARDHLQIEGQVRATVMALEAGGAVGVRTFKDYLEVGVDASVLFVAAGTDGALIPQVGTYVKVRLTPSKAKTVYFKGRIYKAWNLPEGRDSNKEFGIGYEMNGDSYIELSVKEFQIEGESNGYLPFIGFGMKFGGPRERASKEDHLFD